MARKPSGRRPYRFNAADLAAIRNMREAFRRGQAKEIRRVVTVLRDHRILAGVDSTRYRLGATRAHVEEKITEAVVWAFGNLEADVGIARERELLRAKAECRRDAHRRAARALRSIRHARAAAEERTASEYQAEILEPMRAELAERRKDRFLARLSGAAHHLDNLTLDLVAILAHTSDLTTHHVLKEIVPPILAVAWDAYPDCAPARGAESPLDRYKRLRRKPQSLAGDEYLYHRRGLLFAGDGRFPAELFQPHRAVRTVPPIH